MEHMEIGVFYAVKSFLVVWHLILFILWVEQFGN